MNIKDIIDAERWVYIEPPDWNHDADDHNATLDRIEDAVLKHIAELEAQLPKAVTPRFTGTLGHKTCACGNSARVAARYCSNCGSKLNWEEA